MTQETRLLRIEKRIAEREKPKAVLTYSDPLFFARHSLGFVPDVWQERVLSWTGKRFAQLLPAKREKYHYGDPCPTSALYFAKSLILLVSPSSPAMRRTL